MIHLKHTHSYSLHFDLFTQLSPSFQAPAHQFFCRTQGRVEQSRTRLSVSNAMQCVAIKVWNESKDISWYEWKNLGKMVCYLLRGHRECLDGRLCRPDSEQWPLTSNLCTMTIVKLCWHNFTQSAYDFFVSSISYRPTDLSLLDAVGSWQIILPMPNLQRTY